MKDEEKYQEFIAKYLSGEITSDERASLMSWVAESTENQQFFDEMVGVWALVEEDPVPDFAANMDNVWDDLEEKLPDTSSRSNGEAKIVSFYKEGTAPPPRLVPIWQRPHVRRLAMGLALLVGLTFVIRNFIGSEELEGVIAYTTLAGEQETITLPDGSTVVLNENTHLSYASTGLNRSVKLEGEAFFSVERMEDRPFEISSGNAKTVVLGTSFNVRAYPNEETVEVTVASGRVAFTEKAAPQKAVILTKGDSGIFDKAATAVVKTQIPQTNATAWKTKQLVFNDLELPEVIRALERYFDIDIELANEALKNCTITGTYAQPKLEELLKIITFTLNVKVEKTDDGQLIMNGQGC